MNAERTVGLFLVSLVFVSVSVFAMLDYQVITRCRTCLFKDEVLYGNLLIEEVGEGNEQWFMKAFMFKDNVQDRLLKQFAEKLELLVAQLLVFLLSIDRQKGFEGYVKMH